MAVAKYLSRAWPLPLLLLALACGDSATSAPGLSGEEIQPVATLEPPVASPTPPPATATSASVTHDFGDIVLGPGQEIASQCVSWTLDNDEALYVQAVTLSNPGSSHHSNWFVVPEQDYPGPDGYFRCRDREFSELASAVNGTVIFAQSTQSLFEEQRFRPGAVVKIPPRHKVVAGVHFLNLAAREITTSLRLSLEVIHPSGVTTLLSPFRYTYYALDIAPGSQERYAIECDMKSAFEEATGKPFDLQLHWVLPHTHYLGNHFRIEISGGERDGEVIHRLDTYNADANGKLLEPPLDLNDADGLRVICGFRNPTEEAVGWGIGDQEMCVMLGLAETEIMMDLAVNQTLDDRQTDEGVALSTGDCEILAVPRNPAQSLPSDREIAAQLYLPPTDPADEGLPSVPPCLDTPPQAPLAEDVTLDSLREDIFTARCNFLACHGALNPAAGLDLETDPYASLVEVQAQSASAVLVRPGNPAESWLYHVLTRCQPIDEAGQEHAFMPKNAPTLLEPELAALVEQWIRSGANR